MFKGVPSAQPKAESDMAAIAPTSCTTIGNTIVEPNRQAGFVLGLFVYST